MNNNNVDNSRDGRLTIVLVLLFGVLLFDFSKGHMAFSERDINSYSCRQLHYIHPKSLTVQECSQAGESDGKETVSAQFSPFLFTAMPINSANKDMIMTVDGIGPALADDIIAYRRQFGHFTSSTELLNLPGIGPKRAAKFSSAFTFSEKQ